MQLQGINVPFQIVGLLPYVLTIVGGGAAVRRGLSDSDGDAVARYQRTVPDCRLVAVRPHHRGGRRCCSAWPKRFRRRCSCKVSTYRSRLSACCRTSSPSWGAALLFGVAEAIPTAMQLQGINVPFQIVGLLPYVLTIVVVAGAVGRATPPAADGVPYVRS